MPSYTPFMVAGGALLAGCNLAPKYQRPPAPVPATFGVSATGSATSPREKPLPAVRYQDVFRDSKLQAILVQALVGEVGGEHVAQALEERPAGADLGAGQRLRAEVERAGDEYAVRVELAAEGPDVGGGPPEGGELDIVAADLAAQPGLVAVGELRLERRVAGLGGGRVVEGQGRVEQLDRRIGDPARIAGRAGQPLRELALLWVLSQSDGRHDLESIAERSGQPLATIAEAAEALVAVGLLAPES